MTATNTVEFLLSNEAKVGRRSRKARVVVHVETHNIGMQELDADDAAHAERLVEAWIVSLNNKSARIHFVRPDGSLYNPSPIFSFLDFSDCYAE